MKKRYFLIGLLILLIIGSQSVFASAPKMGTSGASELLIPMGARNVAMAGANIANISGTNAIYWNPAGLSILETGEASFSYMDYFADMKVTYLTAGFRAGKLGVLGVSMQVMNIGDINVTTIEMPEGTGEVLSPDYITAGITYANRFTDRISFGTNLKVVSEKLGNMSASTVAFDLGLQYVSPFGIAFGVTMKNIGGDLQYDGNAHEFDSEIPWANPNATTRKTKLDLATHELPTSMNMGLSYMYNLGELGNLNLSGVYNNNSYELDHISVGAEFGLKDMLFLRAGYMSMLYPDDWEWDKESQFGLSMGFGLNLNFAGTNIMFDYANRPMELFDANQYFSVSFGF
jgi:hypothetical protein